MSVLIYKKVCSTYIVKIFLNEPCIVCMLGISLLVYNYIKDGKLTFQDSDKDIVIVV